MPPLLPPPLPPPLLPPPLPPPPGTPALTSGTRVSAPKKLEEVESRRGGPAGRASQGSCSCTGGSGAMIVTFLLRTAAPRSLAAGEQRALAGAGALDAT